MHGEQLVLWWQSAVVVAVSKRQQTAGTQAPVIQLIIRSI